METLFNQFMHVYFWVYAAHISLVLLNYIVNDAKEIKKLTWKEKWTNQRPKNLFGLVYLVLWIMSFNY